MQPSLVPNETHLPGVLWAYRNTPHEAMGEKPSFFLYGLDCRTPTEAVFLPPAQLQVADVDDYRQELVVSLSSARELAAKNIQAAQTKYKRQFDKKARRTSFKLGRTGNSQDRGTGHIVLLLLMSAS